MSDKPLFRARQDTFRGSGDPLLLQRSAAPKQRILTVHQRPRHSGLFEAVHRLDTQIDAASRRELADWIAEQYTTEYGDVPLGFVARCHLGPPFVDHRLDLVQSIVEHFRPGDIVPAPFDGARTLARLASYEFIEVYASGVLVPIRVDGSVDVPIAPGGSDG